jgi:small neutral amino acid transporter SnatA (MarC family)
MVGVTALFGVAQLWHLALGAFLWGLSAAIDEPARASFFPRLLPKTLLRAFERIMGLLLAAIAVEFIAGGVHDMIFTATSHG